MQQVAPADIATNFLLPPCTPSAFARGERDSAPTVPLLMQPRGAGRDVAQDDPQDDAESGKFAGAIIAKHCNHAYILGCVESTMT